MERVIEQYSDVCSEGTSQEQEPTPRPLLISYSLLHDVILLESRGFALRYAADQKRRMLKTKSALARKRFVQMQLEGERPTKFFCQLNKKAGAKAQFEVLHVEDIDEHGMKTTRVINDQNEIEQEVRRFYCSLYKEREASVVKEDILKSIEEVTKIADDDVIKLERAITEGEVSTTLMHTRNNVAPGPGGFLYTL